MLVGSPGRVGRVVLKTYGIFRLRLVAALSHGPVATLLKMVEMLGSCCKRLRHEKDRFWSGPNG
jgi:hypothetical protein